MVSGAGRKNAPVAPSPANDAGRGAAGFSTDTLGSGGSIAAPGVGATGVGVTNTGSGSGAPLIGGTDGNGRTGAGMTLPSTGGGAFNVAGVPMSLKIEVKLGSDAFADVALAALAGDACPNRAVNSPTVFFAGSLGCEENAGTSEGLSPRNGP